MAFQDSQRRLFSDVVSLSGVQYAGYLFPLLTVPYLARVLGPAAWGRVVAGQALAALCYFVVDFGFSVSGVREIARSLDEPAAVLIHIRAIFGAKLCLSVLSLLFLPLALRYIPLLMHHPRLVIFSVVAGLLQGWNLSWVFQGLAQIKLAAAMDLIARATGVLSVFFFVHHPGQGWLVLLLQSLGCALSILILLFLLWRSFRDLWPDLSRVGLYLKMGLPLFLFSCAASLFTTANPLILGYWGTPIAVGMYAGPDRVSSAGGRVLMPVTRAILPRSSYALQSSSLVIRRLFFTGFHVMFWGGLAVSMFLFFGARPITTLLLGPQYAGALGVMRVLALGPWLFSCLNFCALQWLIPMGKEHLLLAMTIPAGLLNLVLAPIFISHWGAVGMAVAADSTEALAVIGMFLALFYCLRHWGMILRTA